MGIKINISIHCDTCKRVSPITFDSIESFISAVLLEDEWLFKATFDAVQVYCPVHKEQEKASGRVK